MPFPQSSRLTADEAAKTKLLARDVKFKIQSSSTGGWLVGKMNFDGGGVMTYQYFGDSGGNQTGIGGQNPGNYKVTDVSPDGKYCLGNLTFTNLHALTHYIDGNASPSGPGERFPLSYEFEGTLDGKLTLIAIDYNSKANFSKGETEPSLIW